MIKALFILAVGTAVLTTPYTVSAQEVGGRGASPDPTPDLNFGPPPAPAQAASPFDTSAVDETMLQSVAGREDTTQISSAQQSAGVSRNSVGDNVATGNTQISGNAFQNMSGLSILNVNTGNNVAINAAMNVNISINQGQ